MASNTQPLKICSFSSRFISVTSLHQNLPFRNLHGSVAFPSSCLPQFSPSKTHRVSIAPVEQAPAPDYDSFDEEIVRLKDVLSRIRSARNVEEKIGILDSDFRVREFFGEVKGGVLGKLGAFEVFLLKCLVCAGQEHVLGMEFDWGRKVEKKKDGLRKALYSLGDMIESWSSENNNGIRIKQEEQDQSEMKMLKNLLKLLAEMEQFYNCIGGILGYQIMALELLKPQCNQARHSKGGNFVELHVPKGFNLLQNSQNASQAALWGIQGLPELGEIYPMGGAGDRLGLIDPISKESLPAALLPYCGKTLLEGLIRDLQAREFLYYKLYNKQCITPVAIMTSSVKNNHNYILALLQNLNYFGRGRNNFRLFQQPLVPVVRMEDGKWLISDRLFPLCKPGGHGAIWKLAYDKGVFNWFYKHGRKGATVRQVSNVVAATDLTILALAGLGLHYNKKLGFASCERNWGATEGINVFLEKQNPNGNYEYAITCVEYTEFQKYSISDSPNKRWQKNFPANTNILYVDLKSAEKIGSSHNISCLPGIVLNLKKKINYVDHLGFNSSVFGGRLECTMQNIADNFMNEYSFKCNNEIESELDTYMVYNERKKVTSSAKKKIKSGDKSLHQTPEGSLLDLMRNSYDILSGSNVKLPKVKDNSYYLLDYKPPFLVFLHPALGPLWQIIQQKFIGGLINEGSELVLEIAEFYWREVELDGSLIIRSDNIMGSNIVSNNGEQLLTYGRRYGRCKLEKVKVRNKGIDYDSSKNTYWKHEVERFESLNIILYGNAEFEASDVTFSGDYEFEVPDGYKMCIFKDDKNNAGFDVKLERIPTELMESGTWFWKYHVNSTNINLEMVNL